MRITGDQELDSAGMETVRLPQDNANTGSTQPADSQHQDVLADDEAGHNLQVKLGLVKL